VFSYVSARDSLAISSIAVSREMYLLPKVTSGSFHHPTLTDVSFPLLYVSVYFTFSNRKIKNPNSTRSLLSNPTAKFYFPHAGILLV